MSGLEDLYREIILDHYRNPRNRGELPSPPAARVEGFNPLCGDEIVVFLQLDDPSKGDDAIVSEVRIGGQGCSISQSSASMMSAAITGRTVAEVKELTRSFKAMMSIHEGELDGGEPASATDADPGESRLGDLEALRGVVKFPVRIKCATLSWNTLLQAIDES
ncbi:MAG: SUF system NifU family Fe-S cluster assembly protein [Microthrixaceae bacterium]|nr:SUF system NifU family Fe-S cluster assembly protein [Microthrixaceae bacterium]MCB9401632.1 SUF system NifU family Fe-S cluster assembly protein [Microthrixaceae bacterium]MCO5306430.1 SUF system NifU family Fe-S cluster assembly protein [Microthrixaceae bacterium]